MISKAFVLEILQNYNTNDTTVATLASHSALDICDGAKAEGLKNLAVCLKGKHRVYTEHYRTRKRGNYEVGCVDETIILEEWRDIAKRNVIEKMRSKNSIFVPHRSFEVYEGFDIINNKFPIPLFGNRELLQSEERTGEWKVEKDQYYLLQAAGIRTPKRYKTPEEIDGPAIVKASKGLMKKARGFERYFNLDNPVNNKEEYEQLVQNVLKENAGKPNEELKIIEREFRASPIEQFVSREYLNANFFKSKVHNELEFLSADIRTQFPKPSYDEHKHIPASVRESKLQDIIYELGEKFDEITQKEFSPGIIGPFALQLVADGEEKYYVYDVSLRNPGSPDANATPYPHYLFGHDMSFGRRIALEIREAAEIGMLEEIVS